MVLSIVAHAIGVRWKNIENKYSQTNFQEWYTKCFTNCYPYQALSQLIWPNPALKHMVAVSNDV